MDIKTSSHLTIFSFNIHGGLLEKLSDPDFLEIIDGYDVILLSETWRHQKSVGNIKLNGYNEPEELLRKIQPKRGRKEGGIVIYIRENLTDFVKVVKKVNTDIVWLCIKGECLQINDDVFLAKTYIPPDKSTHHAKLEECIFNTLERDCANYAKTGKILVCGDLNGRIGSKEDYISSTNEHLSGIFNSGEDHSFETPRLWIDSKTNAQGNKLLGLCKSQKLCVANGRFGDKSNRFTFKNAQGYSVVDYAVMSHGLLPFTKDFEVMSLNAVSDHAPICIKLDMKFRPEKRNETPHGVRWKPLPRIGKGDQHTLRENVSKNIPLLTQCVDSVDLPIDEKIVKISNILCECVEGIDFEVVNSVPNDKNKEWFDENCTRTKQAYNECLEQFYTVQNRTTHTNLVNAKKLYVKTRECKT